MAFVRQLYEVFASGTTKHNQGFLRNKNSVDVEKTDLELFKGYRLGDLWEDARLPAIYMYLRRNPHLMIPDSWQATIDDFDHELDEKAP